MTIPKDVLFAGAAAGVLAFAVLATLEVKKRGTRLG
jgi:hypothetical protein